MDDTFTKANPFCLVQFSHLQRETSKRDENLHLTIPNNFLSSQALIQQPAVIAILYDDVLYSRAFNTAVCSYNQTS